MSVFRCPSCDGKIKQKDYDEVFQWYECPSCEGCFEFDELLEGGGKAVEEAERPAKASAKVKKSLKKAKSAVVAKGKIRLTEIAEDEEAAEAHLAEMLKPKGRQIEPTHHRDEIPTKQVVNIMADEIQALYRELGESIDEPNARDKALTIWRTIHFTDRVPAREQEMKLALCAEHS